jgi:hypothetical protein
MANLLQIVYVPVAARGSVKVKELCCKLEGRGFQSPCRHCSLSSSLILPETFGPGLTQPLTETSTRNRYKMRLKSRARMERKADLTTMCVAVVNTMWVP